jgi:hypothetical protein
MARIEANKRSQHYVRIDSGQIICYSLERFENQTLIFLPPDGYCVRCRITTFELIVTCIKDDDVVNLMYDLEKLDMEDTNDAGND